MDSDMEKWNPLAEDYYNDDFNRYRKGPGRNLPHGHGRSTMNNGKVIPYCLYVTKIPADITEIGLYNLFQIYGPIVTCRLVPAKQQPYTYGFVEYTSQECAEEARQSLNGFQVNSDYKLSVNYYVNKKKELAENERFDSSMPDVESVIPVYNKPSGRGKKVYESFNGGISQQIRGTSFSRFKQPNAQHKTDFTDSASKEEHQWMLNTLYNVNQSQPHQALLPDHPKEQIHSIPSKKEDRENTCEFCKHPGYLRRCTGCLKAFYCSRSCQVSDWTDNHELICQKGPANSESKTITDSKKEHHKDNSQRNYNVNNDSEMHNSGGNIHQNSSPKNHDSGNQRHVRNCYDNTKNQRSYHGNSDYQVQDNYPNQGVRKKITDHDFSNESNFRNSQNDESYSERSQQYQGSNQEMFASDSRKEQRNLNYRNQNKDGNLKSVNQNYDTGDVHTMQNSGHKQNEENFDPGDIRNKQNFGSGNKQSFYQQKQHFDKNPEDNKSDQNGGGSKSRSQNFDDDDVRCMQNFDSRNKQNNQNFATGHVGNKRNLDYRNQQSSNLKKHQFYKNPDSTKSDHYDGDFKSNDNILNKQHIDAGNKKPFNQMKRSSYGNQSRNNQRKTNANNVTISDKRIDKQQLPNKNFKIAGHQVAESQNDSKSKGQSMNEVSNNESRNKPAHVQQRTNIKQNLRASSVPQKILTSKDLKHLKLPHQLLQATYQDGANWNEFYIQLSINEQLIAELTNKITKHCTSQSPSKLSPAVGQLWCAQWLNCWYRAKVCEVIDAQTVHMYFLDYGNSDNINVKDLRLLNSDLLHLPSQAIRCCIHAVKPHIGEWCESALELFSNTMTNPFYVKCVDKKDDINYVQIFTDENGDENIAEVLKSKKLTLETIPAVKKTKKTKKLTEDKSLASLLERGLTGEDDGIKSILDSLKVGDSLTLMIIVDNQSAAWAILVIDDVINDLQAALQARYGDVQVSNYSAAKGEIVAAKSKTENEWYRARIVRQTNTTSYVVFYLDFGNCEEVECISKLDHQFTEFPAYAVRCSLLQKNFTVGCKFEQNKTYNCVVKCRTKDQVIVNCELDGMGCEICCSAELIQISDLADVQLTVGCEYNAAVLNVYDLQDIQFIKEQDIENLINSSSLFDDYCSAVEESNYKAVIDEIVFGKYEYSWYRANVISVTDEGTYKVQYVDYGNVNELKSEDIRRLPRRFTKIPKLSSSGALNATRTIKISPEMVEYVMHGMKTITVVQKADDLLIIKMRDAEGKLVMDNLLEMIEVANAQLQQETEIYKQEPVQASIQEQTDENQVDEITKRNVSITSTPDIPPNVSGTTTTPGKPTPVSEERSGPTSTIPALEGYVSQPDNNIGSATCSIPELEDNESQHEDGKNSATAASDVDNIEPAIPLLSIFMYSDCPSVIPEMNKEIEMVILSVMSPDIIHCAIPSEESVAQMDVLTKEINSYCNNLPNTRYEPMPAEVCLAKFSEDEVWYRAVVIEAGAVCLVLFADYGNFENVATDNIRKLKNKDYLRVPLQAFLCKLDGVEPIDEEWPTDIRESISTLIPPLSCQRGTILSSEESNCYITDFPSIKNALIKANLAKPTSASE